MLKKKHIRFEYMFQSNINILQLGIGFKITDTLAMLGRGIACIILAMVTAWKFSIVFLALFPLIGLCSARMVSMIKKYTIKECEAYSAAGKLAQEVLSSIRTVYAFGLQKKKSKSYEKNLIYAEKMSIKKGIITGIFSGLTGFLMNAMFGVSVYYGIYLIRTNCAIYKPGLIMQSFFAIKTTTFVLSQILPFLKDLTEGRIKILILNKSFFFSYSCSYLTARVAAKSIFKILEKKSEIDVKENKGKTLKKFEGSVQFEDVNFSYPQRIDAQILHGLTLSIPAGKTVALCGSSGGGKSTVIQLLQRFYDPLSGVVKVDGCNIKELDLEWLRNQMALVSQEPVLFALSIKENIRLGRLEATDDECIEAAKQANAHNFIMGLKDTYDTLVGERGTQMSGGQKQRIAM